MFSDAVDREAAWLNASGDGLPALNKAQGGPFQIVQARWPRVPATSKSALYVLRPPVASYRVGRFADMRSMPQTQFMLRLFWPLNSGTGSSESDQLKFEQAIDLVLARVEDSATDKTHGGRFLSVGEDMGGISVHYDDPEQTAQARMFRASITYAADDPEIVN